jgi:predicted metal-dependent enzyme (double-stranded beta helix superfamily)
MVEYVTFEEFVAALRALPPGDPCDPDMIALMDRYRIRREELERYVVWDDNHYTRHLVYRDERFQVILLGWGVGQVTPVHDHAGQCCWMRIEAGRLQMMDYKWKEGAGPPSLLNEETVGGKGADLHLDRCASVHRIANRESWGERAISLHVYSRPFTECGTYCLDTGAKQTTPLHFDSIGPCCTGRGDLEARAAQ